MAGRGSSQKFIERNRPPRVQIGCDVELYGSRIKVNLPWVMGVMADLSGKWEDPDDVPKAHQTSRGELDKRKFLEIDQDNFSDRMKAMKPRVSMMVDNTLTGEGKLPIDLTFESMDDFSPDKVAMKVDALRQLFETRKQLENLLTYAGGKESQVQKFLKGLLDNPDLMKALMAAPKQEQPQA